MDLRRWGKHEREDLRTLHKAHHQRAAAERAANGGSSEAEDKSRFKLADPAIANPGRVVPAIARAIFSLSRLRGGKAELAQVRALLEPLGCARGISELEGVYKALIES